MKYTTTDERKDMIARIPACAYMAGNGKWQGVRRDIHRLIADLEFSEAALTDATNIANERKKLWKAAVRERDEAVALLRDLLNGLRSMRGGDRAPVIAASKFLVAKQGSQA